MECKEELTTVKTMLKIVTQKLHRATETLEYVRDELKYDKEYVKYLVCDIQETLKELNDEH